MRGIKKYTVIMIMGLLLTGLSGCGEEDSFLEAVSAVSPLKGKNKGTPTYELQKTFRQIYDMYKDSVVFISTEKIVKTRQHPFFNDPFFREFFGQRFRQQPKTQKRTGLGTGFIISKDGYICTNHHVIANMDKVLVKVDGEEYKAKVIGSDEATDIALLKIEDENGFKPVYFGDSDAVKVGDWAIAIGNPFGLDKTFTVGVISSSAREDVDSMGGSFLQTDASINPGNSGGPLINIDGEVVGVNRMIYSRSGGSLGIGFAIPVNTAKSILDDLKKYKKVKRGYMGVQIAPLSEEFAEQLGLKSTKGALIGSVMSGSPAAKAGLQEKDVIIKAAGKDIEDYRDLVKVVRQTKIGKTIKVQVIRNKSKANFWVTIKERPSS